MNQSQKATGIETTLATVRQQMKLRHQQGKDISDSWAYHAIHYRATLNKVSTKACLKIACPESWRNTLTLY